MLFVCNFVPNHCPCCGSPLPQGDGYKGAKERAEAFLGGEVAACSNCAVLCQFANAENIYAARLTEWDVSLETAHKKQGGWSED